MSDLLLRSRRVILPGRETDASVRIRNGRITDVLAFDAPATDGEEVRDLSPWALMPGLVDTHVHINEPGRTEWEGLATASRAAIVGGITTLVDMPLNCSPVITTRAALEEKLRVYGNRSALTIAHWAGVVQDNAAEVEALLKAGLPGAKCFLTHSGIDEFPNAREEDLRRVMPILHRFGAPLLVHAELDVPSRPAGNPRSHALWVASRPPDSEVRAVQLVLDLCREFGTRVHIVHVAAMEVLPLLRAAMAEDLPVTAETCPHYLLFSSEGVPDGATEFKCAPPIREAVHHEALWEALRDGTLQMVVSDHSPCPPEMKGRERGDFFAAWGGIASLQLGLPLIWTEAARRGISLQEVVRWMSYAPAMLAGLGPQRGRICGGSDADLVAFDPDAEWTIEPGQILHRHRITPYLGRRVRGVVRHAWIAGNEVTPQSVCPT